jgi:hypothetical protein
MKSREGFLLFILREKRKEVKKNSCIPKGYFGREASFFKILLKNFSHYFQLFFSFIRVIKNYLTLFNNQEARSALCFKSDKDISYEESQKWDVKT